MAGADTCVAPVLAVAEVVGHPQFAARRAVVAATHPTEGELRQLAPLLAGMDRVRRHRSTARHDAHRHRAPAQGGRRRRRDGGALGGRGGSWHDGATRWPQALDLVGKEQYHEVGEFPVERGYVWTSCASVENGNPLFWDDEVAEALTGGPIAPPTMVSVWFRPHHWAPGRTEQALPLQVHFDLKELFGLPEAVMTDNTIEFHAPVRMGDVLRTHQVLRSVSEEKTTKLGTGRFWVIDVVYANQDGELVAVESYTGFGYRREDDVVSVAIAAPPPARRRRRRRRAARRSTTRSARRRWSWARWPPGTGGRCTTTRTSRSTATGRRTSS